jgi:hypothetical protein
MSSYVEFYVEQGGTYINVGSYSRSNPMYQILSDMVPYEKGMVLDDALFNEAEKEFEADIKESKDRVEALKNTIQLIGAMEGSIVEKVEAIEEKQSLIKEYEEDIEMYEAQFMQFKTFYRMIDPYVKPEIRVWVGVEWNPNYKEDEE